MDLLFFTIASLIGSMAFALSGFMIGVRKGLDIMGIFIVAALTANGGGVVRDVLVNRAPVALKDINAFYTICLVLLVAAILRVHKYNYLEKKFLFIISDSIGLVAFSITGALVGIESELNFFGVTVLAFVTATGGGIIRDTLLNEVPIMFSREFYGSVAIIIASVLYVANFVYEINNIVIVITFVFGLVVRLLAYFYDWHLPGLGRTGAI